MQRSTMLAALTVTLTLGAAGCLDQEADAITGPDFGVVDASGGPLADFTVYTQNMWLGGDTGPLFTLPFGDLASPDPLVQQQALGQIIAGTLGFYGQVQASDVPARASEIAAEIAASQPDVVALQEAVSYATGTLNLLTFQFTPTAAGPSLLGSLMAEVGPMGYQVAMVQPTTSIALPMGPPDASGLFPALGVQDMVVILTRSDVEIADRAGGLYADGLPIGPTAVRRGWARVTVDHDGMPYHFISTHLETQGSGDPTDPAYPIRVVHNRQAAELQDVIADLGGNVILMGDLNSDANGDPSQRSWTPTYGSLVDAGFVDVWFNAPHGGTTDGVTCCFAPGRTPDERIDFVLLRQDGSLADRDSGLHRGFYRADVVGGEPIAADLWASDHAGIVATLSEPTVLR